MSQCLQATVPLVNLLHNVDSKNNFYIGDNVQKFLQFTRRYHKSSGSIDPSSSFSIICKQKHYFGNFSQQDSSDALITMLDAIITDQKKALKIEEKLDKPLTKIYDSEVPIGQLFSFYLSSRCIFIKNYCIFSNLYCFWT